MLEHTMRYAHKFCNQNYEYLKEEQTCRCIYCLKEFNSKEISDIDICADDTVLCPYCWIDAVIGEKSGFTFSNEEAKKMQNFFFKNYINGMSEHMNDLIDTYSFRDLL